MNYEKKLIREVKLKDGETITDPKQIEKELENFYSDIYTSKKDLNSDPLGENDSFESFVEGIDQFRYIKIQSQTIDLRTRLWGITPQTLYLFLRAS